MIKHAAFDDHHLVYQSTNEATKHPQIIQDDKSWLNTYTNWTSQTPRGNVLTRFTMNMVCKNHLKTQEAIESCAGRLIYDTIGVWVDHKLQ